MNESLRRALLRARLSEEDVAARLEVDPKTVRRWLEGRVPYSRHRWILATTLGLDEVDLWPQLTAYRSRTQEIRAIYPHREVIPRETWLRLFGQARERIDILASSALFLTADAAVMASLADRAAAGVKERICLGDPDALSQGQPTLADASPQDIRDALARYKTLRHCGNVEVRVSNVKLSNPIYRADDECLVAPSVYGISASRTPVIRLHCTTGDDIFGSYLKSFETIWATAYLP